MLRADRRHSPTSAVEIDLDAPKISSSRAFELDLPNLMDLLDLTFLLNRSHMCLATVLAGCIGLST